MDEISQSELFSQGQEDRNRELVEVALANKESLVYYALCNQLKIKPEDPLLFEKGNILSLNRSKSDLQEIVNNPEKYFSIKRGVSKPENLTKSGKPRKRYVPEVRYFNFLKEGCSFFNTPFVDYANEKKNLLIKYFPSRFGGKGKQPIVKYDNAKIGSLFRKVYESYNNR